MKKSKTFKDIVNDVMKEDNSLTRGHSHQIVSIRTTEKMTKTKNDVKYKQNQNYEI